MRKVFTPQQKATVALSAIKGQQSINQLSSIFSTHPTQVNAWKNTLTAQAHLLFADKRKKNNQDHQRQLEQLYQIIGQRDMEMEWLKKKLEPFTSSG